ncbi:MAG TPA: LysR family transcriptional regulator [Sphingobium sp.]|uniref:LysR family transcriptional regulator n=1 Tax=Sphingobium sp. TaxID=1912891 RepID=UPI002ED15488
MKRTHLPLNGLRVFDAAARHLSFTRAADELAVTPAAVGQQIRALEDMLGVVLFRRTPKGLELTPEAEAGLPALRSGFLEFEESVRAMQVGQSSQHLTIAAPRDFIQKWLSARLADYMIANPELSIVLIAAEGVPDFTESNLDLAISLTDGAGGHEGLALGAPRFVRVGAHEAKLTANILWPGSPDPSSAGAIRVPDAGLAIEAAMSGLGTALVPALLAQADIDAGRVRAVEDGKDMPLGYWLIAPLPQWRQKKVKALVEALQAA